MKKRAQWNSGYLTSGLFITLSTLFELWKGSFIVEDLQWLKSPL